MKALYANPDPAVVPAALTVYDFGGDMAIYLILLKSNISISDYTRQRGKVIPFDLLFNLNDFDVFVKVEYIWVSKINPLRWTTAFDLPIPQKRPMSTVVLIYFVVGSR